MEDDILFQFPLGNDNYLSPTRRKMVATFGPIEIGDIVTPFLFHKNGKPVLPDKKDYKQTEGNIGVVVKEFIHPIYNEPCYEVSWTIRNTYRNEHSSYYVKKNIGCYLVKLTQ